MVQQELRRYVEAGLTELKYAASSGQIDAVEHLLARGLPIDAGVESSCSCRDQCMLGSYFDHFAQ